MKRYFARMPHLNAPNIPPIEISPDLKAFSISERLSWKGILLNIRYYPALHIRCGSKLLGIIRRSSNYYGQTWKDLATREKHLLGISCRSCRLLVGKKTRRILLTHGKLSNFTNARDRGGSQIKDYIVCHTFVPRGLEFDSETGEVIGYVKSIIDKNEFLVSDAPEEEESEDCAPDDPPEDEHPPDEERVAFVLPDSFLDRKLVVTRNI